MSRDGRDALLVILIAIMAAPILWVWGGFVVSVLWGWYLVPFGIEQIGIAHAIGLGIAVSLLATRAPRKSDRDDPWEILAEQVGNATLRPAAALLGGWIVHFFM